MNCRRGISARNGDVMAHHRGNDDAQKTFDNANGGKPYDPERDGYVIPSTPSPPRVGNWETKAGALAFP